jgi:hypothetical protein
VKSDSQVYFARCLTANGADMGAIKIGCTYSLDVRLVAIGHSLPFHCEVITSCAGTMFEESAVHLWLADHRISGEYFHDAPEVLRFVAAVQEKRKLPLHLTIRNEYPFPSMDEAFNFMARHGLAADDLSALTRTRTVTYQNMIARRDKPNRRFIAALMVAALKKGHHVDWRRDLGAIRARVAA